MRGFLALVLMTGLAHAEGETAGNFDYYVLSLSWTPNWCALEGDARRSPRCEVRAGFGWSVHGLWPQFEDGWPSYCQGAARNPTRAETAAEAGLFGTSGNAWHQWNKHGRCSGLAARDYYALARAAFDGIDIPDVFRRLDRTVELPASVVEEAFLDANSDLSRGAITITCKSGRIQEARICMTRDLEFRDCATDVARDCRLEDAVLDPIR